MPSYDWIHQTTAAHALTGPSVRSRVQCIVTASHVTFVIFLELEGNGNAVRKVKFGVQVGKFLLVMVELKVSEAKKFCVAFTSGLKVFT